MWRQKSRNTELRRSTKEPETLEWTQRYFMPNDVFYGVGANIGIYSLFAAVHLNSRCKVYAFEPEALNHAKLGKNVYLKGLSGVILPCCLAVADRLSTEQRGHPLEGLPSRRREPRLRLRLTGERAVGYAQEQEKTGFFGNVNTTLSLSGYERDGKRPFGGPVNHPSPRQRRQEAQMARSTHNSGGV